MTGHPAETHHVSQDLARSLAATLAYFAIVFAVGCILGPVRVLLLEPHLGRARATLLEAPLLIVAMIVAAHYVTQRFGLSGHAAGLAVLGIAAFSLVMLADLMVGLLFVQMSIGDQLLDLMTPGGLIYLGLLAVFAAMPLLSDLWWRRA
jgi:hypothetical protein